MRLILICLFLSGLLLIPDLLLPLRAGAEVAWFASDPAGSPLSEGLRMPEEPWATAQELERIAERDDGYQSSIDLDRHQMIGHSGPFRLQVGQQSIPDRNLILNNFRRRGFSLAAEGEPGRGALRGFLLQALPVQAGGDGLGLANEGHRIGGVLGEITPISQGPVQVQLSAGYVAGQRPGRAPDDSQEGGAWTAVAEAGVSENFHVRGEVARSRFIPGESWGAEDGQAASFLVRYQSVLRPENAFPVEWHLRLDAQEIDPLFYSLGNPELGADRQRMRFSGGLRQDRLRLNGSLARERNNVKDLPLRDTVERYDYALQLQYDLPRPLLRTRWLGAPRYSLVFDGFRRKQLNRTAESRPLPVDDGQQRLQWRVDFSRDRWQWGAGYRVSAYGDRSNPFDESRQRALDLRLETRLGERLFLYPTAEFGTTAMHREEMETARLGLRGRILLIPDRLKGGWDLLLSREEIPGGRWERNTSLSGDLTWALRSPREGRAGFDLSLSGSRREREDNLRSWRERLEYRLFLALTMILPPSPG